MRLIILFLLLTSAIKAQDLKYYEARKMKSKYVQQMIAGAAIVTYGVYQAETNNAYLKGISPRIYMAVNGGHLIMRAASLLGAWIVIEGCLNIQRIEIAGNSIKINF